MTLENNRKCMVWEENKQDLELRKFIRWLISLRKKHPQWCEASIQWKDVEHPTVIAYQRDNITFFLNNSEDTASFIYNGRVWKYLVSVMKLKGYLLLIFMIFKFLLGRLL
ncbi:Neopullulanase [Escherichia coli]|uniref:Neopullulanase n=1 Tax=Escherichia coli TaxID=562 RepID=A0A377CGV3_ECOLX|nr:Neopullulanase [Escherichia coli]